jgi:hypothetical protein
LEASWAEVVGGAEGNLSILGSVERAPVGAEHRHQALNATVLYLFPL